MTVPLKLLNVVLHCFFVPCVTNEAGKNHPLVVVARFRDLLLNLKNLAS